MGTLEQRRKPLTIRKVTETMAYVNKACEDLIRHRDDSGVLYSCPICETSDYVVCTGTNRGKRKFKCVSPSHDKDRYFSTSTSFEAILIYQDVMTKNLALLLKTNSVVDGIRDLNETSKHFVELPMERLYEYITHEASKEIIHIAEGTNIVTIFSDLTGSGLAKNKAIILAMVGDVPIFDIVTSDNYLSTMGLIATIAQRLEVPDDTQIVFVTDGEQTFVDPIRKYFPDAIHIRQFHKKSSKGMVYVHLNHGGMEYTIRCLWDVVLGDGTPSDAVQEQRSRRAKKRKSHKDGDEYTELSKDVMIWKGRVFNPRGVRRKRAIKRERSRKGSGKRNTSPPDTALEDSHELIFRGRTEAAKNITVFNRCLKVLKGVFGGLHITSNVVENLFNIKSKLKEHRTMRYGNRILVCLLYGKFVLKHMDRRELIQHLKDEVITKEFIRTKTLYGSGAQKNSFEAPSHMDLVERAIKSGRQLVIHYRDWKRKHTSRIITPMEMTKSSYDNVIRIRAFCHLRDSERTFHLDRIRDLDVYDPDPFCFINGT